MNNIFDQLVTEESKEKRKQIIENYQSLPKLDNLEPIVIGPGTSNIPGIPYQDKVIQIPKNLKTTGYLLGINTHIDTQNTGIANTLQRLAAVQNNQTEILSYIVTNQLKTNSIVEDKFSKNLLTKVNEQLEQNRQNIRNVIKEVENSENESWQNLSKEVNRIINQLNETEKNNSSLTKDFELIKSGMIDFQKENNKQNKILEELKEKFKQLEIVEEKISKAVTTIEEVSKQL